MGGCVSSYLWVVWRGWDISCLWTVYLWLCLFIILFCRAIVLTYQEHLGVTYITLNEDPCPRMLIHNKCPIPLLLKENVKGRERKQDLTGLDCSPHISLPFLWPAFWVGGVTICILQFISYSISSYLLQKLQGLRCTVVLCLLIVPCIMSSTTTFPVSLTAGRERWFPLCCWKPPQTTAPQTGLTA